ncbi:MAG TPA: hypothetical protein VMG59_11670 [Phycisphaerae bacterium]|nr:hypothetical protein [Phycisphaerae bacterium]
MFKTVTYAISLLVFVTVSSSFATLESSTSAITATSDDQIIAQLTAQAAEKYRKGNLIEDKAYAVSNELDLFHEIKAQGDACLNQAEQFYVKALTIVDADAAAGKPVPPNIAVQPMWQYAMFIYSYRVEKFAQADALLIKAFDLDPTDPEVISAYVEHFMPPVQVVTKQTVVKNPNGQSIAENTYATLPIDPQKARKAIDLLTAAIQAHPESPEPYNFRAAYYRSLGGSQNLQQFRLDKAAIYPIRANINPLFFNFDAHYISDIINTAWIYTQQIKKDGNVP